MLPNIDFSKLLSKLNISNPKKIIVENPEELKLIDSLVTEDNLENVKSYLITSVLLNSDSFLTSQHRKACDELKKYFME